jgi:hypothetical protein
VLSRTPNDQLIHLATLPVTTSARSGPAVDDLSPPRAARVAVL